jgi:hypothetical protein
MPTILNFKNVEEFIFKNNQIKQSLPHLKHIFDNWNFGYKFISMKFVRKQAVFDLLRYLSKDDMKIISKILNDEVIFTEDISKTIFNIKTTTDLLEKDLPDDFNLIDLSIYRKGNNIGVTLWK